LNQVEAHQNTVLRINITAALTITYLITGMKKDHRFFDIQEQCGRSSNATRTVTVV